MKKVHFIGICGKGMSATALLLMESGYTVTGSDEGFYPPVSTYIEKNNIPFIKGYKKENIESDVDTVVIGKHAKLSVEENEEVKYAFELKDAGKVKIKSFPEILKTLTEKRENIVVAGSFGKSTCTSLLAHILEFNKLDTGYFIGATPITPSLNAHVGTHKNFILEGDEYPSSNWDSISKFMYYNANDVLITAMAHDHVNIFKTHNEFKQVFYNLIAQLNEKSYLQENHEAKCNLVLCVDDESISKEFNGIKSTLQSGHLQVTTYSLENKVDFDSNYFAQNIVYGEITKFDLIHNVNGVHTNLGTLETNLLGKHNIQNIVGVCAMILEKKIFTSFKPIQDAVKSFQAVEGRLNLIPTITGFKIYEGFGSSFDKAKSAIEAIKLHYPNKNLKIIFEPHTFSWRNREVISWYDKVFKQAKKVFIYEPPTHGATSHSQLSQAEIVERVRNAGVDAVAINKKESAIKTILENIHKDEDILLTLSSSDIAGIPVEVANKL